MLTGLEEASLMPSFQCHSAPRALDLTVRYNQLRQLQHLPRKGSSTMTPFITRFPVVGGRETRIAIVPEGNELPAGEYNFVEFYCNEPGCDCRRVIITVMRPDTGWSKCWASINYGWESLEYYRKWMGAEVKAEEIQGPCLDPLNAQSEHAPALLDLFKTLIESPAYVERLARHYRMFRESVDREHGARTRHETARLENRRKRLRDPGRRRRR
jgi:hypothetical protein